MTNYFSHDSNARNDVRILALRMKHGAAGYAAYFMILERMRDDSNYRVFIGDDGDTTGYDILAYDLRVDASLVRSVINDFGLFFFSDDGNYAYSQSFLDRMASVDDISAKRSAAARKRWEKNSQEQPTSPTQLTLPIQTASTIKQDKSFVPTTKRVYELTNRMRNANVPADTCRTIIRLLDLGSANDTELYLSRIENGERYTYVADELRRQEEEEGRATTTYLSVQLVEELAVLVPDISEQEAIIDTFRNGTRQDKHLNALRVKAAIETIHKKARTPGDEVRMPGRFILKAISNNNQ